MNLDPSLSNSHKNVGPLAKFVTGLTLSAVAACSSSGTKPEVQPMPVSPSPTVKVTPARSEYVPGCQSFTVYAQNRFQKPGTALRVDSSRTSQQIGGYTPNTPIAVDGWKHTSVIYAEHTKKDKAGNDFENDVWFHVADNQGWVSYQGVRRTTTEQAASNLTDDVGPLVPLKVHLNCEQK